MKAFAQDELRMRDLEALAKGLDAPGRTFSSVVCSARDVTFIVR
jgi:hypothetical protein